MALLSVRPSVAIVCYFVACSLGLGACVHRAYLESLQRQGLHAVQRPYAG
jgi:hypothetical protein